MTTVFERSKMTIAISVSTSCYWNLSNY